MNAVAVNQEYILETLRANRDRLRKEFGIDRIGLYGSFARNEKTKRSDIDLVFDLQFGFNLSSEERERLYRILKRKLHRKLDLVEWKYMNPIIGYHVRKNLIYV